MRRCILLAMLMISLPACSLLPRSGGYYEDDGPGDRHPADISNIPDAVPRDEAPSASGNKPYIVRGRMYRPLRDATDYRERGVASWYGKKFHGRRTASGEIYDMYAMTAAHKTLPLPSYVRVRNLHNNRSAIVRVNDRGPFLQNRLIDLSYAAASKLGIVGSGTGVVEVKAVSPDESKKQVAEAPAIEVISSASAAPPTAETEPPAVPRLFLQVGAFTEWGNASNLRIRLERAGFRPIFIQSVLIQSPPGAFKNQTRMYRVRIGPLAGVEEADLLVEQVAEHGIYDALIVVE